MNMSRNTSAFAVFIAFAVVLGYLRRHLQSMPRTSLHEQVYFEDSRTRDQVRYRVLVPAKSTGNKYCVLEVLVRAGATLSAFYPDRPGSPPLHLHRYSDETFDVKEGVMSYVLENSTGHLNAGASVTIPAGAAHTFWNEQMNQSLLVHVTLQPPGLGEFFFENFAGLGAEYGSISAMNPLQLFLTLKAGDVVPLVFPGYVWWGIENVLCPLVQMMGLQPTYEAYRSLHQPLDV